MMFAPLRLSRRGCYGCEAVRRRASWLVTHVQARTDALRVRNSLRARTAILSSTDVG